MMKSLILATIAAAFLHSYAPAQEIEYVGSFDSLNYATEVFVSGGYAYVGEINYGIQIINIADPVHPFRVSSYDTPGFVWGLFFSSDYVYVADHYSGLQIIDVTNPYYPVFTGNIMMPGNPNDVIGVFVRDSIAYVVDGMALRIVAISDPANPVLMGSYESSGLPQNVFIAGDYAYVATGSEGLKIINITNPLNPYLVGEYNTSGDTRQAFILGGYAYVADGNGLRIIDISEPSIPTLTSSLPINNAIGIYVEDYFVYMAGGLNEGLKVIDVSDAANPFLSLIYDTPGAAHSIFVAEPYIYIADHFSLLILRHNLSNVAEIALPTDQWLSTYPNPFNSATTISFELDRPSYVTLAVYNLLGQKVAIVFEEMKEAGAHRVTWEADGMPSGTYLARLTTAAGETRETRMVLVK